MRLVFFISLFLFFGLRSERGERRRKGEEGKERRTDEFCGATKKRRQRQAAARGEKERRK